MGASLVGRLLVATPRIGDPNFERTVILVLAHGDDEGTFGVVINRASGTPLADLIPAWSQAAAPPLVMFLGGPVAPSAVVGVGVADDSETAGQQPLVPPLGGTADLSAEAWRQVLGQVGTIDLNRSPDELPVALRGVRLFAGSAGWSAGQLDSELAEQAWWVLDLEPDDVVSATPEILWRTVLRRQSGTTAWFASFPVDPLVN